MKLIGAALRGALWGSAFSRAVRRGELELEDVGRVRRATFKMVVGGVFHGKIIRDGEVVDEFDDHNIIVGQGLDHILSTEFCGTPPISTWFVAPFGNNYSPIGTDTAASISGNAGEISTYTATSRQPFAGIEGSQQVSNAAQPASFTFTAKASVYGAFIISSQGIGSTSGILFAAAQFASPKPVDVNDQLLLTYTLAAQSAT